MGLAGANLWTRRQVGQAALGMADGVGFPRRLRAATGEMHWTEVDSLRAHAAAHGMFYAAAAVPELLDVDGFAAGSI